MKKVKIEIKSYLSGKLLFEYESKDNTIKKTLIEAVNKGAYLSGADLRGAYLSGAYLSGAYLSGADLSGAYLRDADLSRADLSGADLSGADLSGAYLRDAYLRGAYLSGADLSGAELSGADLRGAYLSGADLSGADLSGANGEEVKIKNAAVFTGIYEYVTIPFISEKGEKYIKLGCFTRTLKDWESDFWNNESEFPNDGSIKSELRVIAFKTAKKWLKLQSK